MSNSVYMNGTEKILGAKVTASNIATSDIEAMANPVDIYVERVVAKIRAKGSSDFDNTNCYMVDAPGWYIFPMVYGNAIEDTRPNESSYKAEISGSSVLGTLVNHLNKPISKPYIADNDGCNPQNAYLVWQDANGLLRPSYTWDWDPNEIKKCPTYIKEAYGGKGGIRFYVAPESIKQGNAVIAVSDKAPVVTDAGQGKFDFPEAIWSWHIWVTRLDVDDADKTIAVTNHDNNIKLDLMPMNLGQSIIFPQSGYRDWDDKSNTYHFNRIGYVWTSGSADLDSNKSFNLEFSRTDRNGYIHPLNPFYPCDGFTVRPLHKIRRSDP